MIRHSICSLSRNQLNMVVDLQETLAIGSDMLKAGNKIASQGLLISGHSVNDLEKYLDDGGQVTGIFAHNNKLAGYILEALGYMFTIKCEKAGITWKIIEEKDKMLMSIFSSGNYVYLDQIGVRWEHHKTGVADKLLGNFEHRNAGKDVFVMVMNAPINNIRSLNFFLKHEYCRVAEIFFDKFGTIDNFHGLLLYKHMN